MPTSDPKLDAKGSTNPFTAVIHVERRISVSGQPHEPYTKNLLQKEILNETH